MVGHVLVASNGYTKVLKRFMKVLHPSREPARPSVVVPKQLVEVGVVGVVQQVSDTLPHQVVLPQPCVQPEQYRACELGQLCLSSLVRAGPPR
jgi:hypothetical protein